MSFWGENEETRTAPKLPVTANDWQLYDNPGCEEAAQELTAALKLAAADVRKDFRGGCKSDVGYATRKHLSPLFRKFNNFGAQDSEVPYTAECYLKRIAKIPAGLALVDYLSTPTDLLLEALEQRLGAAHVDDYIDLVLEQFDSWFLEARFDLVDECLERLSLRIQIVEPQRLVALVSAAKPGADKLANFSSFRAAVRSTLARKLNDAAQADTLLLNF